ncbi:MAG: nuclear transport factor 2 family protein [Rhodomicrobium sp.]
MMNGRTNKQIVEDIFNELARGNGKPFGDAMADDFQWTIKGTTPWSRTYAGKQTVRTELLAPLFAQFDGTYTNRAKRILSDGDTVIVECEGSVVTKSGKPYCNSYCYVIEMENGKFKSLTEYLDTALVEAVLEPPR